MPGALPGAGALPTPTPSTGIFVQAVPNSTASAFDVYQQDTNLKVLSDQKAGQTVTLAPGNYLITRATHPGYVWASGLSVVAGAITQFSLGAIRIDTVQSAADGAFATWDASGDLLCDEDSPNQPVAAPPGEYSITAYDQNRFSWASALSVSPGEIVDVPLGAVEITVPFGTADTAVSVDSPASSRLEDSASLGELHSFPAGAFNLVAHLNDKLLLAGVSVTPGSIVEVSLSAIDWTGPTAALWDSSGTIELVTTVDTGKQFAVGAGEYAFEQDKVEIALVLTSAGEVTTAG